MNMDFNRKLTIPSELKQEYPVTKEMAQAFERRDRELKDILSGNSSRLVLIVGPCSADREESVLDYISRLVPVQEQVKDQILIVPRVYTNKPRTTGAGYKGMLHQPDPSAAPDMLKGLISIRELHMRVLRETGFSCADEMLYPENYKYLDDVLAYVAVGARSVENQQHRLTSSGISVPVGMKNPTGGDLSVMMNSINAAQHSHTFIYRGWEATSTGNPYAHAILRGYTNKHGDSRPNYHYEDLVFLHHLYKEQGLLNPAAIIDANHANSGKNPFQQGRIIREVLQNRNYDPDIHALVKGFMVESYIEDGNQKIGQGV
ncbi:MAG: 3-deoxy-7-phosphoheptulonate synthase, partial [Candidatus Faecousia sp.]|nr:3-deoxy-7-phosphoheptulonate synthase [Candidatus Faecousia sp.]